MIWSEFLTNLNAASSVVDVVLAIRQTEGKVDEAAEDDCSRRRDLQVQFLQAQLLTATQRGFGAPRDTTEKRNWFFVPLY